MRFLFYTHSLISDWNHGNAHFLRGVMRALQRLGHEALALEPEDSWSRQNLVRDCGEQAVTAFVERFPHLRSGIYGKGFDHEAALADADVVIVHEWTAPALIARIGRARRNGGRFRLLFHDTHHRAVSARQQIAGLELEDFDGVLAFGEALRERYLAAGWGRCVFTWHEAADLDLFRPMPQISRKDDLIWIGNWGDGERAGELREFLFRPSARLGLTATVRGVRYPREAREELRGSGIRHGGWLANADVPRAFAARRMTVHVPRRPYVEALPGIPTIRVFEALACGIPLISAPWDDAEGLFRPGSDFLVATDGAEMERLMALLLADADLCRDLVAAGLDRIRTRHSCDHRAAELLAILDVLDARHAPRTALAHPPRSHAREAAQ